MAERKKLLIISAFYLRSNSIASVRPRKLAKYLNASSLYDMFVLAAVNQREKGEKNAYKTDLSVMEQDSFIKSFYIAKYPNSLAVVKSIWNVLLSSKVKKKSAETSAQNSTAQVTYPRGKPALFLEFLLNFIDDMAFYRRAKRVIRKRRLWETDIMFSTYGPFSCHLIARYIKRKNPDVFWIADFRDPVYHEALYTPALFKAYAKGFTKNKCNTANVITAVGQAVFDCTDMPGVPSYVILNGYDPDDVPRLDIRKRNDKFTLTYTGSLYNNKRDLTPVFRALRELIDDGILEESKLQVAYAGAATSDFTRQIEVYNLQSILKLYGFVSREEALEIQRGSDILLVAQLALGNLQGKYSGKLFEYMMMEKPVIFTMAGEHPDNAVRELFEHCSLGFYYEQANADSDYVGLKDYVLKQYKHFTEHGSVLFSPNREEIAKYSYPNIAKELEELIS